MASSIVSDLTSDEKLSESVRKYPVLFDKSCCDFKNKLKKQMAWADVASEVGLQNDAYVLFDEDQEGERTTTAIHLLRPPSWNTRLRLRMALCLRLRWTCELPCAYVWHCACVCVARVNQP
ncbi:PREDICTED: uncharacterized protein LOC107342831 [Acropora digitifera]|uniref:uncharacterized protein LOC107342831 n=1 Tax=Acropora digitifera TaxID=70779 RepID=UPI00077AD5C7|nr:PREDICTED: uncharacterized protein LOC107342831 [Acropora digitifera]